MNTSWHSTSSAEILSKLETSEQGLLTDVANERLDTYGRNKLETSKRIRVWNLLLKQFQNFIIYILLFAVVISAVLGETVEVIAISAILVLNAAIGFIQEWQAERRIKALSEMVPQSVQVYRDSELVNRPVEELVPGDVMVLEAGTVVPADGRILSSSHARVVESSLTGESEPEHKQEDTGLPEETALSDRTNMVYASTLVSAGRLTAVVVDTGMQTEIGNIATLLNDTKQAETPLQRQLDTLGKKIGKYVLILCFLIFVYGVYQENALQILMQDGLMAFFDATNLWIAISLSLAVAAVPEGLPTVVTIALSLGVKRMAKKQALVRRLSSVESLGETTVICTDKTGTLTQNIMTVQHLATIDTVHAMADGLVEDSKVDDRLLLLLRAGALCNNAAIPEKADEPAVGDPTEVALVQSMIDYTGNRALLSGWRRIDELQFDSDRKSMSTIDAHSEYGTWVHTKGAIERIVDISTHIMTVGGKKKLTATHKKKLLAEAESFAADGMRVLACAMREWTAEGTVDVEMVEQEMVIVGMQAMIDPPHEVVPEAIATCKRAGIRVIMITGDNPVTASAIAAEVGIDGDTMRGDEFMALDDAAQREAIKRVGVFSRVAPAHKYHIVSLLQQQGEIVAMTGDGVNDAPAIKKADFGIAMGINGTDISKQSSDMILLDDNFATIVSAIEEGRNIYQNIRKVINFLLSSNSAEILIIVLALLFGLPLPLAAIMILWINLVTDGLPALALSVDPTDPHLMDKPPKDPREQFITRPMLTTMGIAVILITAIVLCIFFWAINQYAYLGESAALMRAQTIAFTTLITLEIVRISIIRREYDLSFFSNWWLLVTCMFTFCLHIMILYTPLQAFLKVAPLSFIDWLYIALVMCAMIILSYIPQKLSALIHHPSQHT